MTLIPNETLRWYAERYLSIGETIFDVATATAVNSQYFTRKKWLYRPALRHHTTLKGVIVSKSDFIVSLKFLQRFSNLYLYLALLLLWYCNLNTTSDYEFPSHAVQGILSYFKSSRIAVASVRHAHTFDFAAAFQINHMVSRPAFGNIGQWKVQIQSSKFYFTAHCNGHRWCELFYQAGTEVGFLLSVLDEVMPNMSLKHYVDNPLSSYPYYLKAVQFVVQAADIRHIDHRALVAGRAEWEGIYLSTSEKKSKLMGSSIENKIASRTGTLLPSKGGVHFPRCKFSMTVPRKYVLCSQRSLPSYWLLSSLRKGLQYWLDSYRMQKTDLTLGQSYFW
jgi:Fungal protein of unknown function (DUF1748)